MKLRFLDTIGENIMTFKEMIFEGLCDGIVKITMNLKFGIIDNPDYLSLEYYG